LSAEEHTGTPRWDEAITLLASSRKNIASGEARLG